MYLKYILNENKKIKELKFVKLFKFKFCNKL